MRRCAFACTELAASSRCTPPPHSDVSAQLVVSRPVAGLAFGELGWELEKSGKGERRERDKSGISAGESEGESSPNRRHRHVSGRGVGRRASAPVLQRCLLTGNQGGVQFAPGPITSYNDVKGPALPRCLLSFTTYGCLPMCPLLQCPSVLTLAQSKSAVGAGMEGGEGVFRA